MAIAFRKQKKLLLLLKNQCGKGFAFTARHERLRDSSVIGIVVAEPASTTVSSGNGCQDIDCSKISPDCIRVPQTDGCFACACPTDDTDDVVQQPGKMARKAFYLRKVAWFLFNSFLVICIATALLMALYSVLLCCVRACVGLLAYAFELVGYNRSSTTYPICHFTAC